MRLTEARFANLLTQIANNQQHTVYIDFSFDELNTKELDRLAQALKSNHTCKHLNLNVNAMQIPECQILAKYLKDNIFLEHLELSGCSLSSECVQIILGSLHNNRSLNIIDLIDNNITDGIIIHLRELLSHNTSIKQANLTFNDFSKQGIEQIKKMSNDNCVFIVDTNDYTYKKKYREQKRRLALISKLKYAMQDILLKHRPAMASDNQTEHNFELWSQILQKYLNISNDQNKSFPLLFIIHEIMLSINQVSLGKDDKSSSFQFINFCLQDENLTATLIGQLINLPHGDIKDHLLDYIGNELFMRGAFEEIDLFDLINAYICFSNTSDSNRCAKILALEVYRILLSNNKGLIDHSQVDLTIWKQSYIRSSGNPESSKLLEDLDALINAQERHLRVYVKLETLPGTTVHNTLLIFSQRNMKAKTQNEMISRFVMD